MSNLRPPPATRKGVFMKNFCVKRGWGNFFLIYAISMLQKRNKMVSFMASHQTIKQAINMTINLQLPQKSALRPSITVFGAGGAGSNAVSNMISSNLEGVNFVVANTDAQALDESLCEQRIQLGEHVTQGLGAGAYPEVGRASAEESLEEINQYLQGCHMVFITAGLGGGTGTGASPVIAKLAREQGILTVGVVTKPFHFEGNHRMRIAELGMQELQKYVDTLIVIPNQNLFRIADKSTTFLDAFKMADNVLHSGVRGITDLMVMPGMINLDFSDVRSVMSEMGKAMMGTGEADGDNRATEAAEAAIANPLLDNISMKGAKGVLINITGGMDMTLFEADEAANRIKEEVEDNANIIFGTTFDKNLEGKIRVSVVATGIDNEMTDAQGNPLSQENKKVFPQGPASAVGKSGNLAGGEAGRVAAPSSSTGGAGFNRPNINTNNGGINAGKTTANVASGLSSAHLGTNQVSGAQQSGFVAPEPVQPRNNFGTISQGGFNAPSNRAANETGAGTGVTDDSRNNSRLFGGLFGSTKRPEEEPSQSSVNQGSSISSQQNEDAEGDQDNAAQSSGGGNSPSANDLDIPAFLRRKSG